MTATNSAPIIWRHLNGIVCLYKPAGYNWERCLKFLQHGLVNDLNQLNCREPRNYVMMTGDTSKFVDVKVGMNYADHPLVVGPRYLPEDVRGFPMKVPGIRTSGVCLVGINKGKHTIEKFAHSNPLSTYHVVGQFGLCTDNKAVDGRILYTCNYNYLKRERIDKIIAGVQAIHRKYLLKQCGFHPQSQDAYELIASGNLRPLATDIPVLYSIKCIDWQLPYFTLEIVIANENEDYFLTLVDEIGMRAKNIAVGTSIRCFRCSVFSIEDALLKKEWDLQSIINNMHLCRQKLENNEHISQHFRKIDDFLDQHNVQSTFSNNHEKDVIDEREIKKN